MKNNVLKQIYDACMQYETHIFVDCNSICFFSIRFTVP